MLPLIAGHKYFVAFDIKGATTNVSYPRVYLRYYLPDDETAYYINFASSTEYNTDDWTRYADVLTLDANRTWDRLAFGINRSNTGGDTMSLRSVMTVDLTEAFGAGMEPDVEWCQVNIPYFEGTTSVGKEELDPYIWYERDIPSDSDLSAYLANVAAIRAAMGTLPTTPEVPSDMDHLSIEEANAIEKILVDVDAQLRTMATTFIPAGVAISGDDNL